MGADVPGDAKKQGISNHDTEIQNYFLMGLSGLWDMILMDPRTLRMGPIIDVFIHWYV